MQGKPCQKYTLGIRVCTQFFLLANRVCTQICFGRFLAIETFFRVVQKNAFFIEKIFPLTKFRSPTTSRGQFPAPESDFECTPYSRGHKKDIPFRYGTEITDKPHYGLNITSDYKNNYKLQLTSQPTGPCMATFSQEFSFEFSLKNGKMILLRPDLWELTVY